MFKIIMEYTNKDINLNTDKEIIEIGIYDSVEQAEAEIEKIYEETYDDYHWGESVNYYEKEENGKTYYIIEVGCYITKKLWIEET